MTTLQHIFAATDLSAPSLQAVDRAFQLAQVTGARCTVMHALGLDALGPLRTLLGDKADEVTRQLTEHQRQALQAVAQDPGRNRGVTATVQLEPGMASSTVPACAAAAGADLVTVGAQGDGPLGASFIGSTASRLLRQRHGTVLVVRNACHGPYQRVLIPVDFSPASQAAIHLVRAIAPEAFIVLLHVFDVPFEGMLRYAGVSQDEVLRYRSDARLKAMQDLNALARQTGLGLHDFTAVTEHGHAVQHILATEAQSRCDLVVMGKHGTHLSEELLLGSTTRRVLAQGHADLLVVVDPRSPKG